MVLALAAGSVRVGTWQAATPVPDWGMALAPPGRFRAGGADSPMARGSQATRRVRTRAWTVALATAVSLTGCSRILEGDDFRDPPPAYAGLRTSPVADAEPPDGDPAPWCGDGTCAGSETVCNCADDCGAPTCGDGSCCPGAEEDTCSCAEDCGAMCGDGCCSGNETTTSCVVDCGTLCGDGTCNGLEDACVCPADCSPTCEPSELRCCGDGLCCGGEKNECALDCDDDGDGDDD